MDEIFAQQSLTELRTLVESKNISRMYGQLAEEFLRACLYKNAEEWNRAVWEQQVRRLHFQQVRGPHLGCRNFVM